MNGRNIVSIDQFTRDEVLWLLQQAEKFKDTDLRPRLERRVMRYAFWEASTRTKESFIRAAEKQGMNVSGFGSGEGTSLQKNESTRDTLEMLKQYDAEVIVMRHPKDGAAQYAADIFNIPIINAGDGKHEHPTQTLLDMFTINQKYGRIDGLKIGIVGDLKYGRTAHSLVKAMRKYAGETQFLFVSPDELAMPKEYTEGHTDHQRTTLEEAINKCNVLYVTRMQLERITDPADRQKAMGSMKVTKKLLTGTPPNFIVMHPLPNDKTNPTIEPGVENMDCAVFYEQAGNGVYIREALLCAVLGKLPDFKGKQYTPPKLSTENNFEQLDATSKPREEQERHIGYVDNGVVIDHIPSGLGRRLYRSFKLEEHLGILAENLESSRQPNNRKDIIKLVGYELQAGELSRIGILAPSSKVSVIKNGQLVEKYRVKIPDLVEGLLNCQNDNCISTDTTENVPSKFQTIKREPTTLACHYCDTKHTYADGSLKLT